MELSYYCEVPIKRKFITDNSIHDMVEGFYLSGCHIDEYMPGILVCEYACNTCYKLHDKYKSVKSIEELKVRLLADGIFPKDWSLKKSFET